MKNEISHAIKELAENALERAWKENRSITIAQDQASMGFFYQSGNFRTPKERIDGMTLWNSFYARAQGIKAYKAFKKAGF